MGGQPLANLMLVTAMNKSKVRKPSVIHIKITVSTSGIVPQYYKAWKTLL
jgi:adenine C2-methylase RlmN of 23S rRNA A2503 and tRNA A37